MLTPIAKSMVQKKGKLETLAIAHRMEQNLEMNAKNFQFSTSVPILMGCIISTILFLGTNRHGKSYGQNSSSLKKF